MALSLALKLHILNIDFAKLSQLFNLLVKLLSRAYIHILKTIFFGFIYRMVVLESVYLVFRFPHLPCLINFNVNENLIELTFTAKCFILMLIGYYKEFRVL